MVSHPQRAALVDLYAATRGSDTWLRDDNWLVGDPCDTSRPWYGVQCRSDQLAVMYVMLHLRFRRLCDCLWPAPESPPWLPVLLHEHTVVMVG